MALSPVMVELRASIGEFRSKMGEAKAEVAKFSAESNSHLAKFQTFGRAAALGVGAGLALVGVESIKMAGQFQQSTSVLQTAAGESTKGLKVVREGILDIARSTGTTWQQLTEGMYQVEKAGYRGADGLKILRAAAQGAKEEGAQLDIVTSAMTSIMASYNIPADKAVQVMNALKTAAAGSKDTMQNFAGSLSTVLPIASAAHLSFAQVGGALAALTRHGTSSREATQELAFAIRNLIAPNMVAANTMAQFGISATEVSKQLGTRGLTGTTQYLIQTLAEHTKGGLVQIGMMRNSAAATADLKNMMGQMSPAAKALASDLMSNTITVHEYRMAIGKLDPSQAAMGRQFATLELKAKGFSDAMKSGQPIQVAMESQLKKMTGGALGLQAALMLSGGSTAYANEMTKKISDSMNHASKEVEGWQQTSKLLDVRLGMLKQTIETAAIQIGTKLIPIVTAVIDWFGRHKLAVEVLAVAIGTVLVAAIAVYIGSLLAATATGVASFAKLAASAVVWSASTVASFSTTIAIQALYAREAVLNGAKVMLTYVRMGAAAVAGAAVQVGAWVAVAAAATAAFIAENLATLGIIAGIAALVAAAIYLYKNWDQIWSSIKRIVAVAAGWVRDQMIAIVERFGPVRSALSMLAGAWSAIWGGIQSVTQAVGGVIQSIIGGITSSLSAVTSAVGAVVSTVNSAKSSVGSGLGAFLNNPLSFGGGKAVGGPVTAGMTYLVGERGPELFRPDGRGSGTITPNDKLGGNMNETNDLLRQLLSATKAQPREMQRLVRTR